MASPEIDTQFDRAVEIVQSLPKTGPIQTDYEEKLTMYRYAYLVFITSWFRILKHQPIVCISKVLRQALHWHTWPLNIHI